MVDAKAKEYLVARSTSSIKRQHDPSHGMAHITMYGTEITGTVSSSIQHHQAFEQSKVADLRHGRFTLHTWDRIDHRAMSCSTSLMSTHKKIFITKWISKQLPVGSILLQRHHRVCDTCPMCQNATEDICHLTTCPSTVALNAYTAGLEKLSAWMQQSQTDPIIHSHIISVLSLRRSQPSAPHLPYPCILTKRHYYDAFKEQETIGWTQFTEGLITPQWEELQHNYYHQIGVKNNGKVWAAKLLSQLWDLNFHVWNSRNAQLHSNSPFLNQLHGQGYLDIAIEKEFCHGKANLPSTFSPFFSKYTIPQLKSLPIESKLKWFKTIRTAREDNGSDSITDDFTTNRALRKWAGLRPP